MELLWAIIMIICSGWLVAVTSKPYPAISIYCAMLSVLLSFKMWGHYANVNDKKRRK